METETTTEQQSQGSEVRSRASETAPQTPSSKFFLWLQKIKNWYHEYKRVVLVAKKPTKEEYMVIVKVSGLGILLIGLIGFIIQMVELAIFK